MNELATSLLSQFERCDHVGFGDAPDHFVAVYFRDGGLLISGIGEGMPPFVAFREDKLWVASDPGEGWIELTHEDTGGLQVLMLLDPRIVLRAADGFSTAAADDDVERWTVNVQIKRLPFMTPEALDGIAASHGTEHRVELIRRAGLFTGMVQPDITPDMPDSHLRIVPTPSALPWSLQPAFR